MKWIELFKKTIKNNYLMLSYIHKFCPGHITLIQYILQ